MQCLFSDRQAYKPPLLEIIRFMPLEFISIQSDDSWSGLCIMVEEFIASNSNTQSIKA